MNLETVVQLQSLASHVSILIEIANSISKMFEILQKYQLLVEVLGFKPVNRNNVVYRFGAILFGFAIFCGLLMSLGSFITNMSDLIKATNSLICTIGFLVMCTMFLHMWINRDRFSSMANDLQDIVNESECEIYESKN